MNSTTVHQNGSVLIVDDIRDVRLTLQGLLGDEGYHVCVASNRFEALEMIETRDIKVAVLDVRLDETNSDNQEGLVLMREIKEKFPAIAVIVLTGYADIKMVREALQPRQDGHSLAFSFLEKTEISQLVNTVRRAFEHFARQPIHLVKEMVYQGENEVVEFKSSIRWNYKQKAATKDVQEAVAIAIAGMLNNQGGTILIGVTDEREIIGIEKDIETLNKKNLDGFELFLRDIIRNNLGIEHATQIRVEFVEIERKTVCIAKISRSPEPVFFSLGTDSKFWVRMGNSTRNLDVKATMKYIENHWTKSEKP
jgi:CheY-like chemotaxis protein